MTPGSGAWPADHARGVGALGNGVLFLLGALSDPGETFTRARGRTYWATAAVLLAAVQMAELARVEAHPVVWVSVPVILIVSLMLSYPLTSLARWICGGPAWLVDATASQGVILTSAAALPGSLLAALGVPALTAIAVGLVLAVVAVVAQVALWCAAFRCRWWRALLAYLVVGTLVVVVAAGLVDLLTPQV